MTLIAFNAEGCSDTLVYADTIIVNIQPIADFSADILEGCSPVEITFTNNSSGLSNPVYEWDFGNGDVSMLSDPSYTYMNQGVYTVSLIVTNDQGVF
ncbi:MAG: PKD domain-containing protein [Bacteroidetes bacterium]|nr:PKD domain-containing protein [Bacteroidota bacterium]